jgi:putative ABC transport system substrate-binding protein
MRRREFIALLGGVVAARPLAAHAEKPALPVIGYLGAASKKTNLPYTSAFMHGLAEMGFTEGRDFAIDYRWAEGHSERLPTLAGELVRDHVAVIFANGGTPSARAAMQVTSSIPIVFSIGDDPIRVGLVDSINRPTGNMTGASFNFTLLGTKRWGLLREMVPRAKAVAVLVDADGPSSVLEGRQIEEAARTMGEQVFIVNARGGSDVEAAFTSKLQQRADALLVTGGPFLTQNREEIVMFAARRAMPAMYFEREFVTAGGLMSYGAPLRDNYHQAGIYVGQLLKGAKPSDLPVVQGAKIELVINLKTAKSLGIAMPPSLMIAADEMVE